jgi:hypothetical protein
MRHRSHRPCDVSERHVNAAGEHAQPHTPSALKVPRMQARCGCANLHTATPHHARESIAIGAGDATARTRG